jgi:hypothetical protein
MKRDHNKRNANGESVFVPVLPFTNPIILTILLIVVVVLSVTISSVHSMASSGMKRILVTGGNKVRYDMIRLRIFLRLVFRVRLIDSFITPLLLSSSFPRLSVFIILLYIRRTQRSTTGTY